MGIPRANIMAALFKSFIKLREDVKRISEVMIIIITKEVERAIVNGKRLILLYTDFAKLLIYFVIFKLKPPLSYIYFI